MTTKTRKSFSKEYKAEVLALVRQNDGNVAKTSKALDISKSQIYAWLKQQAQLESEPSSASLNTPEKAELKSLRREVKDLRMERDFLKKTATWFAAQSK